MAPWEKFDPAEQPVVVKPCPPCKHPVSRLDTAIVQNNITLISGLHVEYNVIVILTGLPIGYSIIVILTGLPIGYSVIVTLTCCPHSSQAV